MALFADKLNAQAAAERRGRGWTNLVHNYDGKRSDILPRGWSRVRCNWCDVKITAYPPNLGMLMESHRETCTGEFDDMLYDHDAWERWVVSLRPKLEGALGFSRIRRIRGGPEYSFVLLPDGTLWKGPGGSWTSSRQWQYEWSAP